MKKFLVIFFCMTLSVTAFATQYYSCKGKYALCTTAACQPVAGKKDLVNCACKVLDGYSVATQQCQPVKQGPRGEILYSRYYPIKSYVVCQNDRPWAWCLDKKCIVDKKDPSKASCACTIVRGKGPYIIVTTKATPKTCTTGIISSATMDDVKAVADFINTQKEPKNYPVKVLKNV